MFLSWSGVDTDAGAEQEVWVGWINLVFLWFVVFYGVLFGAMVVEVVVLERRFSPSIAVKTSPI